jgi:hypothetical protein
MLLQVCKLSLKAINPTAAPKIAMQRYVNYKDTLITYFIKSEDFLYQVHIAPWIEETKLFSTFHVFLQHLWMILQNLFDFMKKSTS